MNINHADTRTALSYLYPFLAPAQWRALTYAATGPEADYFRNLIADLKKRIQTMPVTYQQDGLGETAMAHLHYFVGGCDWWITEKDKLDGVSQAFGLACLNGDWECAELGYISLTELREVNAELDFHFTPQTIAEIKARHLRDAA